MAVERYHAPSVKKLLALNSRPRSVLAAAWFLPRHQLAALTNVLGVPRTQAILTDCFVPRNLPRTRANLAFLERVLDDLNPRDAEKFLATAGLRDAQVLTTAFPPSRAWAFYLEAGKQAVNALLKKLPPAEHSHLWDEVGPKRLAKLLAALPVKKARVLLRVRPHQLVLLLAHLKPAKIWEFYEQGILPDVVAELTRMLAQTQKSGEPAVPAKPPSKSRTRRH